MFIAYSKNRFLISLSTAFIINCNRDNNPSKFNDAIAGKLLRCYTFKALPERMH